MFFFAVKPKQTRRSRKSVSASSVTQRIPSPEPEPMEVSEMPLEGNYITYLIKMHLIIVH